MLPSGVWCLKSAAAGLFSFPSTKAIMRRYYNVPTQKTVRLDCRKFEIALIGLIVNMNG